MVVEGFDLQILRRQLYAADHRGLTAAQPRDGHVHHDVHDARAKVGGGDGGMGVDGAHRRDLHVAAHLHDGQRAGAAVADSGVRPGPCFGNGHVGVHGNTGELDAARGGIHIRIRAADVIALDLHAASAEGRVVGQDQIGVKRAVRIGVADDDARGDAVEALVLAVHLDRAAAAGQHLHRVFHSGAARREGTGIAYPALGDAHVDGAADGGAAAGQDGGGSDVIAACVDIGPDGNGGSLQRVRLQRRAVFGPVQADHHAAGHPGESDIETHQAGIRGGLHVGVYADAAGRGIDRTAAGDSGAVGRGVVGHGGVEARGDSAESDGDRLHIHAGLVGIRLRAGLHGDVLRVHSRAGGIDERFIVHAQLRVSRGEAHGHPADGRGREFGFRPGGGHFAQNAHGAIGRIHIGAHDARPGFRAVEGQQQIAVYADRSARDRQDLREHAGFDVVRYGHVAARRQLLGVDRG